MSPNKRRKLRTQDEEPAEPTDVSRVEAETIKEAEAESLPTPEPVENTTTQRSDVEAEPSTTTSPTPASNTSRTDRLARFAALRARATDGARSNLAASKEEAKRSAIDPSLLANLSRRSAIAQHNLLKADTDEADGTGAFERKRAWDYTIEESERWDERLAEKKERKEKNAFQDYSAEAGKIYERQVREMEKIASKEGGGKGRLREDYDASKASLLESAAQTGNLEIVELSSGEMVAIDRDGKFYTDHENVGFVESKPKKENVDRLVQDLQKAEEARMQKRRKRGDQPEEGDVSYINEKNKQFNMKLGRFYDRYTRDIRENFERGTAI